MEVGREVIFQKPLKQDMGVHCRLSAFPAGKGFANSAIHRALAGKVYYCEGNCGELGSTGSI